MRIEVDHIVILTDQPEQDMLAFRDASNFPELWPFSTSKTIQSGALWDGITGIEFLKLEGAKNAPTRFGGLALKVLDESWATAESLRECSLRHIPPTRIGPFGEPDFFWSNVMVGGLLDGEAKSLWLGKTFGGKRWLSRQFAKLGEQMARKPGGQARLNSVLDQQMVFFIEFHAQERVKEQLETVRDAYAASPLTTSRRPIAHIGLDFGSAKPRNWARLLGRPIEPGVLVEAGDVDLEFSQHQRNELLAFSSATPFDVSQLPDRLQAFFRN